MRRLTAWALLAVAAACTSRTPAGDPLPSVAVTHWTDKTELYLEYETLVAGRNTLFAVHLTDLQNFRAIEAGAPDLLFGGSGGSPLRFSAPEPARPGVYRIAVTIPEPGRYPLRLRVASPEDLHDLGEAVVHATAAEASRAEPAEPRESTVSFLKEQQWGTSFRTEVATSRPLRQTLLVLAEVRPRAGGEARLIAPVAGRVIADGAWPAPGSRVEQGQALARIAPRAAQAQDRPALDLALAESELELGQARRNRERQERLLEARAIPARRLEEARKEEAIAAARVDAAQKRLRQLEETRGLASAGAEDASLLVRSPVPGVLTQSYIAPGSAVEEGEPIFQVVDPRLVYVVGSLPEGEAARLRRPAGAEVVVPGRKEPLLLDPSRGRLLSVGPAIEPTSRTLPIVYEVENRDGALVVGQAVSLALTTGEVTSGLAVPESALVDEGNRSIVFVQTAGESFARRRVETGIRDGGYVQVLGGLQEGERVVSEGAYEVRLASLSGQIPAEGHVH